VPAPQSATIFTTVDASDASNAGARCTWLGRWGLGFRVWGPGFVAWGLGFRIWGLGSEAWDLEYEV